MFASWGSIVYRARFTVIGVMVAAMLGLAGYGLSLEDHLSQSGWDDPNSESTAASILADETFGRDTMGDVIALYEAPEGSTVDDPAFKAAISAHLEQVLADHPDQVLKVNGGFFAVGTAPGFAQFASNDRQFAIESIAIAGANDTEVTANFRIVKDAFYMDGIKVQLAGLQPVAGALNDTMAKDIKRLELIAIPAVGILLFFVFGGVVAAALPLIIGGLTVVAANGIVRLITNFTEVNTFVAPVVSLVGLGLAIDYGLFIVSRFREELGEGYEVDAAVRRTVLTAGRTVVFSATTIIAALAGLILFPQGFLKSVAYGAIATVSLAALASITILPALLAIIGRRVDALTFKRLRQTKSSEEIEASVWGRLTRWVMRNPLKVTIPIVVGLLLLVVPLTGIKFGGINETYLPPDSSTRAAQEQFDTIFPGQRTEPVKLVISGASGSELSKIIKNASGAPGLVEPFTSSVPSANGINVFKAGLVDRNDGAPTIEYLRAMEVPDGVEVLVGGTPAIEYDSIAALLAHLPMMIAGVVLLTTLLMFLAFGSLVLPIKAALMSALGLGATLGILTWIFIDGHGAELLNFTPGPIMSPVLVLIIAIVYGLSIDYEVFLLSRMVEARAQGASTSEAIRIGTSHTGRIITAAALILIVVTGAFGFSELVMMKYISYGMIAALIIDATFIRMFLVPAVMKLLGDDCWWAPAWMKRIQEKIGLGEPILDNELIPSDVPELTPVGAAPAPVRSAAAAPQRPKPSKPEPLTEPIPMVTAQMLAQQITEDQKAAEQAQHAARRSATGRPSRAPEAQDEPVSPARTAEQLGGPPTEVRPIESWLADLRSSSGRERPQPAARPAPSTPSSSRPAPSASSRPSAGGGTGTNGHGTNGHGANGHGANGHGANGHGANGHGATSTPPPASPPRPPLPSRPTGQPQPSSRSSTSGVPGPNTPTPSRPEPSGSALSGSAPRPPLPQRDRPDSPQPSPHQQYQQYTPRPAGPEARPAGPPAPVGPNGSGASVDRGPHGQGEPDTDHQTEHRDAPMQGSSGRHRPDDSNAVSVSELIARQNRQ